MATSPVTLAERIYQLGERMLTALEAGRLKTFAALADERSLLIERLRHTTLPASDEDTWRPKLSAQHNQLTTALDARLQHLVNEMHHAERLDKAHREYQRPDAADSILSDNFSV